MDKIKQLENQIIKERKELPKLDGMDWFIKAAHIQPNPNLTTPKKEVEMDKEEIIKALKEIYERAFSINDMRLSLEVMQEIINVKGMREFIYEID